MCYNNLLGDDIIDIKWVTINVTDLEQSEDFYKNILGLKETERLTPSEDMTIVFFSDDKGFLIELIENKEAANYLGYNGVSVGFETERYDEILRLSTNKRILLSKPQQITDTLECFFVRDPNGFAIQVIKENHEN